MNEIKKLFSQVNGPNELLQFMSKHIHYGYFGKNGNVYRENDKEFNEKWWNEYLLESKEDILNTTLGNCWDQVELERCWFEEHGYLVKTIFEMVDLEYDNSFPTHSFLVFKDKDNSWNWFENADFENRGIHKFSTMNELLTYQSDCYLKHLKTLGISNEELNHTIFTYFTKPKSKISAQDYLEFVLSGDRIVISKETELEK